MLEDIINTVREPLVILDSELRVMFASRSFYNYFHVSPEETKGQFIYDLGNHQWNIPRLRELLENIIPGKNSFDDYKVEHTFQAIGHKIMLLNARQVWTENGTSKYILLAIEDVTERKRIEKKNKQLIVELRTALDEIKILRGILPICASCKRIRDDSGYWNQLEAYISKYSEAEFTHSICPDCAKKLYPDF